FDHLHADAEHLLLGEAAGRVQLRLVIRRARELVGQLRVERCATGQRVQKIRVDQRVERGWRAREVLRQTRCRTHYVRDQGQEIRPRQEVRKQLHTCRQMGEKPVELRKGC